MDGKWLLFCHKICIFGFHSLWEWFLVSVNHNWYLLLPNFMPKLIYWLNFSHSFNYAGAILGTQVCKFLKETKNHPWVLLSFVIYVIIILVVITYRFSTWRFVQTAKVLRAGLPLTLQGFEQLIDGYCKEGHNNLKKM